MYRNGHYGLNLVLFAPVGGGLLALREPVLALLGWTLALTLATGPDVDIRLPLISHRGITHTVWAALLTGLAVGGACYIVGPATGLFTASAGALVGGLGGAIGILGHIVGDALTPMGVTPFAPVSKAHYSARLWTADNTVANYGLLATGVFVTSLVVLLALRTVYAIPV